MDGINNIHVCHTKNENRFYSENVRSIIGKNNQLNQWNVVYNRLPLQITNSAIKINKKKSVKK